MDQNHPKDRRVSTPFKTAENLVCGCALVMGADEDAKLEETDYFLARRLIDDRQLDLGGDARAMLTCLTIPA
jgi:hypothetical protein